MGLSDMGIDIGSTGRSTSTNGGDRDIVHNRDHHRYDLFVDGRRGGYAEGQGAGQSHKGW